MVAGFTYKPLADPDSSIRLLSLDPMKSTNTTETEPVRFQLIETSLDSAPSYWALSYAWGSEPPSDLVYCNDQRLAVTANCAAALHQLLSEPETRKYKLWVDSVCIDQSSIEERNHQVALMAKIYSQANQVIVWLGPGDMTSVKILDELNRMALLARVSPSPVVRHYRRMRDSAAPSILASLPEGASRFFTLFSPQHFAELDPLRAVCRVPWFDRLWTLQEIVLAQRATVRLGNRSITWARLDRVARLITAENASLGLALYAGDSFERMTVVRALRALLQGNRQRYHYYRFPHSHPLGSLKARVPREAGTGIASHFIMACLLNARDLQDKVYGQYAILQRHGIALPPPGYERPLAQIYQDVARAIIEHESSLELLYYLSADRTLRDLPSWVPDLGCTWFPWIPGFEFATATGDSKARYRFDENRGLIIEAVLVDRVRRRAEPLVFAHALYDGELSQGTGIIAVIRQLLEVIRFALDAEDITGRKNVESLCAVLMQEIALCTRSSPRKWERVMKHVSVWVGAVMEHCSDLPTTGTRGVRNNVRTVEVAALDMNETEPPTCTKQIEQAGRTTEKTKQSPRPSKDQDDDLSDPIAPLSNFITYLEQSSDSKVIQDMAITRLDGNSMFITEGGRLGLATSHIQEGDGVYLVPGMNLPMIARRDGLVCRLIGAAFLDGAMTGELWRGNEKGLEELRIV
ncbi:heterokaryon incompatibility protein-domain-containing protein [Dactylonectria macrodidyma]|uniref:Heterokaryon incompatibility protein-domain-containing protein n=1 Tax=Dactylonectria macrodidyma TaxID=307937 RepID=A0A9P9FQ19_9HYPO|nr:heterokaryon incompatibility protein-domain-containing protein [Dactylonectria macrodidyma]